MKDCYSKTDKQKEFIKMPKLIMLLMSAILLQAFSCRPGGNSRGKTTYIDEINTFRAEKNRFMKYNSKSPLPAKERESFDSLSYYPINTDFRIIAEYLPFPGRNTLTIPLNNGQSQVYLKHGFATFVLDDTAHTLLVLKSTDASSNVLFMPFYDKTNGFETYGGGRYLEPQQIGESKILIDFNRAYNPFCVYSPDYICPLPPLENSLHIPVTAGEKSFDVFQHY
jgi:uncharacterized protein